MKIRSKLILIGTIPVALLLALAAVFLTATREMEQATNKAIIAADITNKFTELSVLTYEHHIYFEERAHVQWLKKYAAIGKQLTIQGPLFASAKEKELVARLNRAQHNLGFLFEQYGPHPTPAQVETLSEQGKSFHNRITARLLQELSLATPAATTLHDLNHDQSLFLSKKIDQATVLVVGVIAVLLLLISFQVLRAFSVPIKVLHEAFARVGSGDLHCRIHSSAPDELGILARDFDRMAQRLEGNDHSLHRLNLELEERVAERTRQLSSSNAELQLSIAKLRQAEEAQNKYALSLERSNKELEYFAYVASHDLQEPLRKIGSFTELFARKYKDQLDDKAGTYIGYIVDGAQRMQILINDLLSFSRVTTKGREFAAVDCNRLLARVRQDLDLAIQESGAQIKVQELPTVQGDELQLGQVFQNLIANAIKYREPNQTPEIAVEAATGGGEWIFSVRDNGIGIEAQHFARIFQLFQRLHTREEYSGTGIGLALCQKIVERHEGRIWLESTPGQGSTFFFTIANRSGRSAREQLTLSRERKQA